MLRKTILASLCAILASGQTRKCTSDAPCYLGGEFCSSSKPCEAWEGDCDSDEECAGDLVCVPDAKTGLLVGGHVNDFCQPKASTPLLGLNGRCWDARKTMAERDATCAGDLVCARHGFDGRSFGGCKKDSNGNYVAGPKYDHHCCSTPEKVSCQQKVDINWHSMIETFTLNGRCTDNITIMPGQTVSLEANWHNWEGGCRGCSKQIYIGLKGTPLNCLFIRNPWKDDRGSYRKTYSFPEAGTYEIHGRAAYGWRCSSNYKGGYRIATIRVVAPTAVTPASTPLLGLNGRCWDARKTMAERDATCAGDLVCARLGFDGRGFGGCTKDSNGNYVAGPKYDHHCCSTPEPRREPRWADGTLCALGTTCNYCKNGSSFWRSKSFTACGKEPRRSK